MVKRIQLMLGILLIGISLYSQKPDSALGKTTQLPARYLDKIDEQTNRMSQQLSGSAEKYLKDIAAEESELKKKVGKIDSSSANKLFGNVGDRYRQLQSGFLGTGNSLPNRSLQAYVPALDSLKNTLLFLQKDQGLLSADAGLTGAKITSTLGNVQSLQNRITAAASLKDYLDQRKQYLTEQLGKYGLTKSLSGMSQKVYYYKQQFNDLKSSFNDPSKWQEKAGQILSRIPVYQKFMEDHSFLASIFGTPQTYNLSDTALKGLQSRAEVQQMIKDKIATGGPGAGQQVMQQMQEGASQISQLKNKLSLLAGQPDPADLGFTPNGQKTKSIWKRLEYGADLQFEHANTLLPTTGDLALSIGYKLNDNGSFGVGLAYKLGMGDGLQHVRFSNQGLGLRSYIDWKLKKGLYLSGGYEENYFTQFQSISQLGAGSAWQPSGLIGLSKKCQISGKLHGKIQLLFDFLSYNQVPRSQPILFRAGWAF